MTFKPFPDMGRRFPSIMELFTNNNCFHVFQNKTGIKDKHYRYKANKHVSGKELDIM